MCPSFCHGPLWQVMNECLSSMALIYLLPIGSYSGGININNEAARLYGNFDFYSFLIQSLAWLLFLVTI